MILSDRTPSLWWWLVSEKNDRFFPYKWLYAKRFSLEYNKRMTDFLENNYRKGLLRS